jgi:uncharacterized protein (DUF1501 family)
MNRPASLFTRRRLLEFGSRGALGLTLGGLWQAQAANAAAASSPVKACILIFYYGGPSHIDTFDMKPDAPAEVRGEFKPISTSVPGLHICEHLPKLSQLMHKVALVRSMHHEARLHDSASIHALTGRPLDGNDRELFAPLPQVYPSFGSAVARFAEHKASVPFAAVPFVFHNVVTTPAQGGGILGAAYDPLQIEVNATDRTYNADRYRPAEGMNRERLSQRRELLQTLNSGLLGDEKLARHYQRAYELLDSAAIAQAADISAEPKHVRERYGFGAEAVAVGEGGGGGNGAEMGFARHMRGQNLLLARRLVEAGVPFVNVYDFKQQGQNWDAHFKCANQHKTHLLPQADQSLSALISDLDKRGLLDTTLVVAMGEFGRTPKINGDGGRDHWPDCYTILLAGGGVQGGAIHGASDRLGAYPARDPATPGDLAATIFWRFGIDPATVIRDAFGRPHRLAAGEPIKGLFGKG